MPRHVLAATRMDGREIAREERPAAPSLTMVAAYGDLHACDYVTVSQGSPSDSTPATPEARGGP
ncbi:hypothetical protein ABXI76_12560 [Streptomyces parvus]